MFLQKVKSGLIDAWQRAPKGWRWPLFGLLAIPLLVVVAFMVFRDRAVMLPTEKADARHDKEVDLLKRQTAKIEAERKEAVEDVKEAYDAEAVTRRHKIQRQLEKVPEKPSDLVEKMKKVGRGEPLLILFCLLFPLRVQALSLHLEPWVYEIGSEMAPAELYGEDQIVHLEKGVAAPYEGVLLDIPSAARWTYRLDWYQKQLKLDADTLRVVFGKEYEALEKNCAAERDSRDREIRGLRKDLADQAKKMGKPPFWKKATFGFAMGLVVGALVGAVSYKIAN